MLPKFEPDVLWREGMFLCPQHLQRFALDVAGRIQASEQIGSPGGWGLVALEVDDEALKRDVFSVRSLTAVFKDGTLASCPGNAAIDGREFADLFVGAELQVWVGVPARRNGEPELGVAGGPRARYRAQVAELMDANIGRAAREVELRVLQARFFFGDESREGYECLPLARLVRRGKPVAVSTLSETYVPPALTIGASEALTRRLQKVASSLRAQARDLASRIPQTTRLSSTDKGADLAGFVKLQAVNQCVAPLEQLASLATLHPFFAYQGLVQAVGSLAVFGEERFAPSLPTYDHGRLGDVLDTVLDVVESLIPAEVSVPYDTLPFQKDPQREGFFACTIPKDWLAEGHLLCLAVEYAKPAEEVDVLVQTGLKLLAEADLDRVLQGVVPGVQLTHLRTPPLAFPKPQGRHYFRIETEGASREGWRKIVEDGTAVLLTALGSFGATFHLYVELRR